MVVILPKGLYGDWLKAPAGDSMSLCVSTRQTG
jgi:hypothetical protein